MKNIFILSLLSCLFLSFTTVNKTVKITGKVVDNSTQSPLAYATISLLDSKNKKIVSGISTDDSGSFTLKVPAGIYDIKVEYLSFKTLLMEQKKILKDYDMGLIELEPDAAMLEGVDVVEERTTVEYKLDKKVFNVGKDISATGGNVSDVLDNVPSVSVDAGGGISLRGNSNVRVLIDGKPSMLSANGGLEQIPADLVAQIEVITNPSARYEASGTAGIINIILKKNKLEGFGGSIQLTSGLPANHRANINMNYKTKKINLFTNLGYRYADFFGESSLNQSTTNNEVTTNLHQIGDQERNDDHVNFYFGGDYYLNDKNTFTLSYYKNKIVNTDVTDLTFDYLSPTGVIDSTLIQKENYREPQNYNQLEIDYEKTFDKKGKKFTTSIVYDWWNDDENESISQRYEGAFIGAERNINTRDIESSKDLLVQTDFVLPLARDARLEAGFRGQVRRISSEYTATLDGESIAGFNNLLDYDEGIYGAYLQYGQKLKKFNYLLGLRTEFSDIGISDREGVFNDDKEYIGLFPTAHFTYNFSETLNTQLSYSRRINRPRFWQLNPFGGLSDIRNRFAGNPDLNPMYTDSYELGVLKRWEKITINPAVYFQRNTDFFQFVTTLDKDGYFQTMPINLSHENRIGAEISTTYNPAKWLRLSAEFNYYQFEQVGEFNDIDFHTEDDNWSTQVSSRMKFKKGISMQGTFRYRGQNKSGQNLTKAQHSLDYSISKDLFKDKANLTLNFRNILDSRIQKEIISGENYSSESYGKRVGRRMTATFAYRFNRKKSERDRMPGS